MSTLSGLCHRRPLDQQETVGAVELGLLSGLDTARWDRNGPGTAVVLVIVVIVVSRYAIPEDLVQIGLHIVGIRFVIVVVMRGWLRTRARLVLVVRVVCHRVAVCRIARIPRVVSIGEVAVEFIVVKLRIGGLHGCIVLTHSGPLPIGGSRPDHRQVLAICNPRRRAAPLPRYSLARRDGPAASQAVDESGRFRRFVRFCSDRRSDSRRSSSGAEEWSTKDIIAAMAWWPASSAMRLCICWQTSR